MYLFKGFKLHYLLRILCIWFLITFILCYALAVGNNHVQPFLPFISDCGALPPESCVFGQMLNIGAAIMAANMYVKYQHVNVAINKKIIYLSKIWNKVAFWIGNITCLGISIVANFQETTLLLVHLIGASMVFGGGLIYFIIHTRISLPFQQINDKYPEYGISKRILHLRILICILYAIVFISTEYCLNKALSEFKGDNIISWKPEDGGYEMRTITAVLEWTLTLGFFTFFLTAEKDFKSIEFENIISFKAKSTISSDNFQEKK